ncbi:MAG: AarF/ABC1/UbiB kinase family protein [Syntrophomonadaceae bacterium]|nr:AarF/ABC1/UbiB kinase family protein [Syntrophomonadaceae bacterium]
MHRYREVANTLARHGFGFLFDRLGVQGPVQPRRGELTTAPERVRLVLEELGPTYIKLGQLLSTRPDLISREYIKELEKLQDQVPPFSFAQVREVLAAEGLVIEEHFAEFQAEPLASASIGQVHQAILKSGEKVVVKVQRPGIEKVVETDLEILYELVGLVQRRTSWGRLYHLTGIVDEFAEALRKEMDFAQEGRNADKFRKNFQGDPNVVIPRVYWEYTTRRVLVLEYISGVKVSDFSELVKAGFDLKRVAGHIVQALFNQVYDHGFFHADPHPGNIAIASGEKVVFYDFGQVGTVDEVLKEGCMDLVMAMVRYDVNGVTRAVLQIGIATQHVNREELRRDISRLQQKYYGMPLSQIQMGQALAELVQLSFKYQVRVPPELSLMVKMMMTIEGLLTRLDPGLSIVELAEPFGRQILRKRFTPQKLKQGLWDMFIDHFLVARNLPRKVETIACLMEEGELKVKLEHTNLNRITAIIDVVSNRVSLSIIIAAIVVGSSLIVATRREGFMPGFPLVELGFFSAVVLGLFLAYSIIRSGKY